MKVIFLSDVPRVGRKYDVKDISDGYAMNFLFPKKLAMMATPKVIAEMEVRKIEIAIEREVQESLLLKNLEEIKLNRELKIGHPQNKVWQGWSYRGVDFYMPEINKILK